MKSVLSAFLFIAALGSAAQATTPKVWQNEAEKIVLIAVNPSLSIELIKYGDDADYFAQLQVALAYTYKDMQAQIDAVMRDYPGWRSQKVVTELSRDYQLQVPLLSIDEPAKAKLGTDGPYVDQQIWLNRKNYSALRSAIARGEVVVQIKGELAGTVPMMKVLERREVDESVCYRIVRSFPTVGDLISGATMVSPGALGIQEFQFDSTRVALVNDIRDNCFDAATTGIVGSFTDLLKIGIRAKPVGRKLFGETRQKAYGRETFPLLYDVQQREVSL